MEHSFDIEVAAKIGMVGAILLKNIYWWCNHNRANEKNIYDGCAWTYNTLQAYKKLFPYMGEKQIRLGLEKLEKEGYIKVGNYNKNGYDRTKWYAVTQAGITLLGVDIPHLSKGQKDSAKGQKDSAKGHDDTSYIPDIKPDNTPLTPQGDAKVSAQDERFDTFWKAYPKKVGKGAAKKAFIKAKVNDNLLSQMLTAIEIQRRTHQWQKENGQFIPNPSTWLNQSRWEDEPQGVEIVVASQKNDAPKLGITWMEPFEP
jgi:hypothetical protein